MVKVAVRHLVFAACVCVFACRQNGVVHYTCFGGDMDGNSSR